MIKVKVKFTEDYRGDVLHDMAFAKGETTTLSIKRANIMLVIGVVEVVSIDPSDKQSTHAQNKISALIVKWLNEVAWEDECLASSPNGKIADRGEYAAAKVAETSRSLELCFIKDLRLLQSVCEQSKSTTR